MWIAGMFLGFIIIIINILFIPQYKAKSQIANYKLIVKVQYIG